MTVDEYATEIEKELGVTPTRDQASKVRDIIRRSWHEDRRLLRKRINARLDQKPRTNHGADMIALEDAHKAVDEDT